MPEIPPRIQRLRTIPERSAQRHDCREKVVYNALAGKAGIAATALAFCTALGCGERTPARLGIAMGGDTGMRPVLEARQKRFNDSVGARRHVQLLFEPSSTTSSSNEALHWAGELISTSGVVGVVGHESSRSALLAAPVYAKSGMVQIVPTGTSARLATASPWTFALVASDSAQGELLARRLIDTNSKLVTLFVQDDEYGRGVVAALQRAISGHDIQILDNVVQTRESDYSLLVRSVLHHTPEPQALVLITQGTIAVEVARLAWASRPSLLIMGADAANTEAEALRALAPARDKLALVTYWLPDSTKAATQSFLQDYRSVYGQHAIPKWHHAALYDAVGVMSAATVEAGANPPVIRAWLKSLGRSHAAYQGVLGAIDFTGQHAIPARMIRPSANGWEPVQ